MKQATNIFTIIFVLSAFASFYQLGALGNGITMSFANSFAETVTPVMPTVKPTQPVEHFTAFVPERIVIKDAGVDLLVFPQPYKEEAAEVLPHVANYAEGTDQVNDQSGNVGLYADENLKGIQNLHKLLTGSDIIVYGKDEKAIYQVTESSLIVDDEEDVFAATQEPTLTLIACEGEFSKKTYIIKAKLVKMEKNK